MKGAIRIPYGLGIIGSVADTGQARTHARTHARLRGDPPTSAPGLTGGPSGRVRSLQTLNIADAYEDKRFNQQMDKKTGCGWAHPGHICTRAWAHPGHIRRSLVQ